MNIAKSIEMLADSSKYDKCMCKDKSTNYPFIYETTTPKGKCALMKTLVSNYCKGDCKYCVNSAKRKIRRERANEGELANLFMKLDKSRLVQGAFLSSGIDKNADFSMHRLVRTAEIIRKRGYKGYIHLKIIPGASKDMIKRTAELADRISINIETPKKTYLYDLVSQKDFKIDIIRRIRWASKTIKGTYKSLTTQFIVGASEESDKEIMKTSSHLYERYQIKRAFFSAFNPVKGTPLQNKSPENSKREYRLYQTDWLIREYGFKFKELVFGENNNLDLKMDPKYKIAITNKDIFPIDPEKATYNELIKVPGIGPTSANRIIRLRNQEKMNKSLLKKSGAALKRASPFLKIDGSFQNNLAAFSKI